MRKEKIEAGLGSMAEGARGLLTALGVSRELQACTPQRVSKAWREMLGGYEIDPVKALGVVFDDTEYDELVLVRNIAFWSVCEHHLLPFGGVAHVGYLPNKNRIVGLSKLARLVDCHARQLQIQERLTKQIALSLDSKVSPLGVAVVIEASHGCMACRGVRQQRSSTCTSVMLGKFRDSAPARAEVFAMIRGVE